MQTSSPLTSPSPQACSSTIKSGTRMSTSSQTESTTACSAWWLHSKRKISTSDTWRAPTLVTGLPKAWIKSSKMRTNSFKDWINRPQLKRRYWLLIELTTRSRLFSTSGPIKEWFMKFWLSTEIEWIFPASQQSMRSLEKLSLERARTTSSSK